MSRGAKGGLQVEEISPASLVRGANRIQFLPADEKNPESYRVSGVRVVTIPRAETRMTDASARNAGALRDGREATGWQAEASKPAGVRRWEFAAPTQPWGLDFRLPSRGVGTLTVASASRNDKGQVEVKLDGLGAGWHRVPLDKMPATEALTLTLAAGKEEVAAVSELAIEGSPLPADAAPRLSVTYPLSGECVNHRVHVRGFATPADAEGIYVGGRRVDGALARDGSFGFELAAQDAAGRDVVVEAAYAGGVRARQSVSVGRCVDRAPAVVADDGRPRQPLDDVGAPYGVTVRAGEAASLSFAGLKLDIPAGAVDKDVRLTVRPLPTKQVAPLDPGMTNVSPEAQAFRLGPHGMVFKKPVSVTVPYVKRLIPAGHTSADVRTFYYNEDLHRWEQVGLIAQNDGEMVSVTEHFTDFINATLPMPEHPGTQSTNPTSLKDMKLADPSAGIALIAPPTANSQGTANVSFPIDVPPGRHGVQPDLALTYDSDRKNGWLGVGWDLSMSRIEIDTRFGVPKYDGTETYLLDGEMLALAPANPPGAPSGPTYFQRRVEGRFDWIARTGSVATGFTWLVTTKDGIKMSYGATNGSRLSDPRDEHRTFRWMLDKVTDPLQNSMQITYQGDVGLPVFGGPVPGNSEPFVQLYPSGIDYTEHPSIGAAYHVLFRIGGPDGGTVCNRPDTLIDARPGFQVLTRCVLNQIDVKFNTQFVRNYSLVYNSPLNQGVAGKVFEAGHFGKSLLARIDVKGATGSDLFYSHSFDYFATSESPALPGQPGTGSITALSNPVAWAPLQNLGGGPRTEDGISHSNAETLSTATSGDIGLSFPFAPSAGVGASFCLSASDETTWRMLATKGDGVADGVGGGLLNYGQLVGKDVRSSRLQPGAFRGQYTATGIEDLLPSHTDRDLFSINHHFPLASNSVDLTNRARETVTMADINGDGFPDRVAATTNGMFVRLSDRGEGFLPVESWPNYTLGSNTCDDPIHNAIWSGANSLVSAVNKLIAPFTGRVSVAGEIEASPTSPGRFEAIILQNDGNTIFRRIFNTGAPPCPPGPDDTCSGGLQIDVQAGDRIYTQLRALDSPDRTIAWSPEFVYQSVNGVQVAQSQASLREPYGAPIYRFEQAADFKFVGRSLSMWRASAGGTVNIQGPVTKQTTSDNIRVRVVHTRPDSTSTVWFESSKGASTTGTSPVVLNDYPVAVGDTLSFEVLSDLPIDPTRVKWQPIVTYKTFCGTDPETNMSACSDVSCPIGASGIPKCSLVANPIPGLNIPSSDLQQQAAVFFPAFVFQPGTVTKTFVTQSAGAVNIAGSVTKTSATPAPVVVAVQGVHALHVKHVFAPGEVGTVPLSVPSLDLPVGAQLFFTVYSDTDASSAISWSPSVNGASQQVTFRSRAVGTTPDPSGVGAVSVFAGGYHGWSYGLWNAEVPFDETQIVASENPSPFFQRLLAHPPRIQAEPPEGTLEFCDSFDWDCVRDVVTVATVGPAVAPALIPIATDPHTILTAATIGPGLYGLTQLGGCGGPFSWVSCDALPAIRLTSSTNFDTTILAFPPLNGGVNIGGAASRIDMIDMNGDRYPDAVVKDGTLLNTGSGWASAKTTNLALPYGDIRSISHFNYHFGASASGTQNLTDAKGNSTGFNISGGLGGGFSYGQSLTHTSLLDINGDGLPDHIAGDPATGNVKVRLNLGNGFSNEIIWSGHQWSREVGNISDFLQAIGPDKFDADSLRIEDTSANAFNIGSGGGGSGNNGIGGAVNGDLGWTHSLIRTLVDLVDVNGDGLPDQVMQPPGSSFLLVKMNLGNRFDVEKRIPLDVAWSAVGAPTGLPSGDLLDHLANLGLGSTSNALAYTISSGKSKTGGGAMTIVCGPFLTCSFGGSFTKSSVGSNETLSFEDIDADGALDQVLKGNGNAQMFARLNLTSKTNRLKRVTRPLGGNFELDYQRTGNFRGVVLTTQYDMPDNQWALAQVTLNDGRVAPYIDTFHYGVVALRPDLAGGVYDRTERENYGYDHILTTHGVPNGSGGFAGGDGSMVEQFFENHDFYRKGLLKAEFQEDPAGKIFRGTIVVHKVPVGSGSAPPLPRTGIFFPAESDRYTLFYEGASNNAFSEMGTRGAGAVKSKHEQKVFNANGDLTDLYDFGDEQIIDDDLHVTIVSTNEPGTHITRPTFIEATTNATAQMLRRRTAVYAPQTGTLTSLTNIVSGGKVPGSGTPGTTFNQASAVYNFTYDEFGNLQTATDPTAYRLQYTYDTQVQTYRTRTDDVSFGYFSTATYDFRFGAVQQSIDVNGQRQGFTYDSFGRLCTVKGPDDQTASEPTIAMSYSINRTSCPNAPAAGAAFPAYAVTRHKDVQHANDPIDTVTFVDGIERVIQTKKDLDRDTAGNGTVATGMTVSGQVLFDSRGRVSSQAQPGFSQAATTAFVATGNTNNPTLIAYDALGRQVSINVPDGTAQGIQTTTRYSIVRPNAPDTLTDGKLWLLTDVRDGTAPPEPSPPPPVPSNVGRRLFYADSRGNRVAVREFNQIGTATTLTALTTKYVYDALDQLLVVVDAKENVTSTGYDTVGQMISLTNPDAGLTEYRYDLNGNLKEKQTAVLRAASQTIKYEHNFNRLRLINFPASTDVVYTYGAPNESGNAAGNLAGRIKQVTYDGGSELRFYDSRGNERETRTTLNRMSTTTGLPASMTFNMKYTYDWLGRMLTMTFPNWINTNFTFVSGEGELVSYFYDRGGNIDRITGFQQTANPQQTSHPRNFTYLNHVGYNEFEQRTVLTSGNGIANGFRYDGPTRRLTEVNADSRGTVEVQQNRSATPFHRLRYTYDKAGNVTRMTNNLSVRPHLPAPVYVGPLDVSYTYDNLYELRSMTSKYRGNVAYGYQSSDTYTYDEIGNIKTKAQSQDRLVWDNQTVNTNDTNPVVTQLASSRFDHNVQGLTYSLSYTYPAARPHGATPVNETPAGSTAANRTYTYDPNGNNTGNTFKLDTRTQVWDEENRLKQVTRNGGSLAQFRYDDEGERTKKLTAAGDSWYVNQYFVLLPNNQPTKHIFVGETRIATKTDAINMQTPTLSYYHSDHLGTTSYTTSLSQNLVQHERYFAFGELWRPGGEQEEADGGGGRREWLFTGKEWDVDTDLYYFGARYFDPHTDVWQSTDPILASHVARGAAGALPKNLGLYTYGWNNPIVLRDPDGRDVVQFGHLEAGTRQTRQDLQEIAGPYATINSHTNEFHDTVFTYEQTDEQRAALASAGDEGRSAKDLIHVIDDHSSVYTIANTTGIVHTAATQEALESAGGGFVYHSEFTMGGPVDYYHGRPVTAAVWVDYNMTHPTQRAGFLGVFGATTPNPSYVVLGHELLGHGYRSTIIIDGEGSRGGSQRDAIRYENRFLRPKHNLPPRAMPARSR